MRCVCVHSHSAFYSLEQTSETHRPRKRNLVLDRKFGLKSHKCGRKSMYSLFTDDSLQSFVLKQSIVLNAVLLEGQCEKILETPRVF